jgi:hypothetical protein
VIQRIAKRFSSPTGALVAPLAGTAEGYREGGTKGALLGAAAGVIAPELISNPTAQMAIARGLNNFGTVAPLVSGGLSKGYDAVLNPPNGKKNYLSPPH